MSLESFYDTLVPGEPLSFDAAGRQRHRDAAALAWYPLRDDLESLAADLASTMERRRRWRNTRKEMTKKVRSIGERLGAEGGGFLMVLVAHRAQYLHDPNWRAKREEFIARARAMGAAAVVSAGGPLVGQIEHVWSGICGWEA